MRGVGTEKNGGKTKILKRGGGDKLGQRVGALKGWGDPTTNYVTLKK